MPHADSNCPSPPSNAAAAVLRRPIAQRVAVTAPLSWLVLGWRDVWQLAPYSLLHGLAVAAFGMLVALLTTSRFWLLIGALSAFVLVAPVLASSLYALSRAHQHGEPAGLYTILNTWTHWQYRRHAPHGGHQSLVRFGILLAAIGIGWIVVSAVLINLLAPAPVRTPLDFVHHVMLARHGHAFALWLAGGALLCLLVFGSSVVAMPLLLDRQIGTRQAVQTSWRAMRANPGAMALWALLIASLTAFGLLTLLLGLVLVMPLLGHASWHAYRALVDASMLPERLPEEDDLLP